MSESITGKGKGWEFAKYWWHPVLCFVGLAWISFVYMGVKTKNKKWIIEGVIYCIILHSVITGNPITVALYMMMWAVSLVRVSLVRREYLMKRAAISGIESSYNNRIKEELSNNRITSNSAPLVSYSQNNQGQSYKPEPVFRENTVDKPVNAETVTKTEAVEERVVDIPVRDNSPINSFEEIVDINNCEAELLEKLPGISIAMAKKAVAHRNDIGGYSNLDEFYTFLELKPHIISQISDRIKCGDKPQQIKQSGRILDL